MVKRAIVRWRGGLRFDAGSVDGARVALDGGGAEATFRPATLMLAALAGCTGMDALSIMVKKRQAVEAYEIVVTGRQRDEHPRTFLTIDVEHVVTGARLDDEAVSRAIELSARRYCLVGASLAVGDTTIRHRSRIIDDAGQRTCDCITVGPHGAGLAMEEAVPA